MRMHTGLQLIFGVITVGFAFAMIFAMANEEFGAAIGLGLLGVIGLMHLLNQMQEADEAREREVRQRTTINTDDDASSSGSHE